MTTAIVARLGVIRVFDLAGDIMLCGSNADMYETGFDWTYAMLECILDKRDEN
jgi:hypothetical protein